MLKISADIKHPPFEFIDDNGDICGFNVDITNCIAKEMGMDVKLDLLSWTDAISKFETGEYDAVQGMSISGNREERFIFGAEYITVFHSAFTSADRLDIKDLSNIKDYRIAVQENDVGYDILTRMSSGKDHVKIIVVPNQEEALKLLIAKHVDIVVGNKLTILYYIEKNGLEDMIKLVGSPLNITRYGMAFNRNEAKIAYKFKMGMNRIKEKGYYEEIYNKWFTQNIGYYGKQIIENVETGVIYIDKLGRITALNSYASKVMDLPTNKTLFRSFYETKVADIFNTHMIQKILDKTLNAYYGQIKLDKKEGASYLEVNYLKLVDEKNEFMGVLINFKDITEKKRLEESLIRKDKMESLGFLLLNVAHEIRNPLTSIKNFIELIPDNYNDGEFVDSLLLHVPKQIDYVNKLLSNLLEYSKPKEASIVKIILSDFISDESIYKTILKGKSIDIRVDVAEDFFICADIDQLRQVFINVIQNAYDSINEKGIIWIYTSEDEDTKTLFIENSGSNISESKIGQVFYPFFTTKVKGTGLGLYICYQLMKENHGSIEINNTERGVRVCLAFNNKC